MERAFNPLGQLVHAKNAHKYGVVYTCPCCGARVFKAEGRVQSAHFRHERGQGSERCELYVQRLSGSSQLHDYSVMISRPFITFEPLERDWELFITFPYLTPSQAMQCDVHHLHFKIKCNEMNSFISSAQLWPNSSENKLWIVPKQGYSFSFATRKDEKCYEKLGLFWPEYIKGFQNHTYLFRPINQSFCMIEPRELSLSDTFYMMSRKKIEFPREMDVTPLNQKYGWFAYKIRLPFLLAEPLIEWFRQFGYDLKPPYYYLDIVAPSVFGRKGEAMLIGTGKCRIQISFRDFQLQKYSLVHIQPDYTSREYPLSSSYVDIILHKKGFHTFYIKKHEGKMLHLFYDPNANPCFSERLESGVVVDQRTLALCEEKSILKYTTVSVTDPLLFPYWIKEKNRFARELSQGGEFFYPSVEKLFIPGVWAFDFSAQEMRDLAHPDWRKVLLAYMQLEQTKCCWISNEQYRFLEFLLQDVGDKMLRAKLAYYVKTYRNKVPKIVKEFIDGRRSS